jgi:hypothetical protein
MNLSNRIQTEHPDGTKALAPFIVLREKELGLYEGTGIMYAVTEADEIIAIYKKPPIDRNMVSRDEAIRKSGAKGWCKSASIEYRRMVRDEQIRELELINKWHKSILENGMELWKGVFSSTHFSKPEKQKYTELPIPMISLGQAEAIKEIIDYLEYIYVPLKEEFSPVNFDKRETIENYKRIVPLNDAAKNLNDFLKHVKIK